MAALGAVQSLASEASKSRYYFNASRWVWVGKADVEITIGNIRSDPKISVLKIVRIAALCIPAFLYDLGRMAVAKCLSIREARLLAASPPAPPIKSDVKINWVVCREEENSPSIFSSQEPSIPSINPNTDGLDCTEFEKDRGGNPLSEGFFELINRFSSLKYLKAPIIRNVSRDSRDNQYKVLEKTIKKLQGSLERIYFSFGAEATDFLGDGVIAALRDCSHLKELSIRGSGHQSFHTKSNAREMSLLAQKGQLQKLDFSYAESFQEGVLEAFFNHCPLRYLRVDWASHSNVREKCFDTLIEALKKRPRAQRLVSLVYSSSLTDDQLRSLAVCCPDLEELEVPIGSSQGDLFAELLPKWKKLKSFQFKEMVMSNEQILRAVRDSSSLERLQIDCDPFEFNPEGQLCSSSSQRFSTNFKVVRDLAKLGRPLTLDIGRSRTHGNHTYSLTLDQREVLERQYLGPYPYNKITNEQKNECFYAVNPTAD